VASILIVSDAWHPQINGVVRSIEATMDELHRLGHRSEVIGPDSFHSVPLPFYNEIRLAILPRRRLARAISTLRPDAVHIATEGPLGWAARLICREQAIRFTTAFHTRFPEYLRARLPIPLWLSYAVLRRFHNAACGVLVATDTMRALLQERGFERLHLWTRGVDTNVFDSCERVASDLARPVMLYAGRLAVEKNVEAFLGLDLPGTKLIVGDGPAAAGLRMRYPDCVFTGSLTGPDLTRAYRQADVMVFPSRTDTFGLVMIEALACGVPIAAYPSPGPNDVLAMQEGSQPVGVTDHDLATAVRLVLELDIPRSRCRDYASRHFAWPDATGKFVNAAFG
jgi:glycosyltransferase involved in cell wall biosynthesis